MKWPGFTKIDAAKRYFDNAGLGTEYTDYAEQFLRWKGRPR